MNRALDLAERGRGTTSPNPMVGAVVVRRDGTIVGQGYHERAGGPHAEVRALDEAGELARGASLYCTLEPCCHVGRTGPCVERVTAAGIARVVAATVDADPACQRPGVRFPPPEGHRRGHRRRPRACPPIEPGLLHLQDQAPAVRHHEGGDEPRQHAWRHGPGQRTEISSDESRRHAHAVRAEVDAIAVGSETVLVDDPMLTVREIHRGRPLTRVLFDRRLRVSPSARVFSTLEAGPVIIVTTPDSIEARPDRARALEKAGAELEPIRDGSAGRGVRASGRAADHLARARRRRIAAVMPPGPRDSSMRSTCMSRR